MSLQNKLLLMVGVTLLVTFMGVSTISYQTAHDVAVKNLWREAEKVRNFIMAYRHTGQKVFIEHEIPMIEKNLYLFPSFLIGSISDNYSDWDKSGFRFRNVTKTPRNPKNAADPLEQEVMDFFKENPKEELVFKPFENKKGEPYYLYARPLWIEGHCLSCHNKPEEAPASIRERYTTGWSYNVGDLSGILSIKIPANTISQQTWRVFTEHAVIQLAGFLLIFAIIVWVMRCHILNPMKELTIGMQDIAQGDYKRQITGMSGEFAVLSDTFNCMATKLYENQVALNSLNTELEQRVEMRTQELEQANNKISDLNTQLQSENDRLGTELAITRELQEMLLPKKAELKLIHGIEVASFIAPATEVGGDYYDVLPHPHGVTIGIGDVTGHGLESGVIMLMVQMAIRTLIRHNITDLEIILNVVNTALLENIQRMGTDKNLSLLLLDFQNDTVHIAGQHEEVLIVRKNGEIEREDTINLGFTVGLEQNIAEFIDTRRITLQQGDGVVIYTDGITEAFNQAGEEYGIERLCSMIHLHWQSSSTEAIQAKIIDDVYQHMEGLPVSDDITLLVIKQQEKKQ